MKTYFLIVPAMTELAGKCNIYSILLSQSEKDLLGFYRRQPERFTYVGHMNSRGELVAFDGPASVREEMRSCEPLMACMVFCTGEILDKEVLQTAQRMYTNHGERAVEFAGMHISNNEPGPVQDFWRRVDTELCKMIRQPSLV